MKKITSIQIENFRAFYGKYDSINLPEGQNLLIYGENGSGKSSLFKAVNDYLIRSRFSSKPFVVNRYSTTTEGQISIEFADFGGNPLTEVPNSKQTLVFGTNSTTNEIQFVQDAALTKGFLEYRHLLDVYLHKEARPNLFNLIVLNLLANHIPIASGGVYRFGTKWTQLQRDLLVSHNRNTRAHKRAKHELSDFDSKLRSTLDGVFLELNRMLQSYFDDLGIQLTYILQPITFNYGNGKRDWQTTANLKLNVIKDGVVITDDYSDVLNEARLSAFAICLYLASLRALPQVDFQILYLDDVFVGLDAGNRLPILNIISREFNDYQIFISTYDRYWYELSKRFFETSNINRWLTAEFYVGKDAVGNTTFDKPTITTGASDYERAIRHLHDRVKPDYPAAANYFRKSLEEMIQQYIPLYERADVENVQLPDYKLSLLLQRSKDFLNKTGNNTSFIIQIEGLLHALIHPLSHYSIAPPIYKGELLIIESALKLLKNQLIALDVANNYKCILGTGKKIRMTFCADSTSNHYFYYEVILKSCVVLKRNANGALEICSGKCFVDKWYGINGTTQIAIQKAPRKTTNFTYDSLEMGYNKIHLYLTTSQVSFPMPTGGYQTCCEWEGAGGWEPFSNLIIWP